MIAPAALAANAWIWGRRDSGGEDSDLALLGVHLTEALCALGLMLPAVFGAAAACAAAGAAGRCCGSASCPTGIHLWEAAALDAVTHVTSLDDDVLDLVAVVDPVGVPACIAAGAELVRDRALGR